MNGIAFTRLHLGLPHCSTISQPSCSCGTTWLVDNETMPYTEARHLSLSVKHVLLHIGQHRLDPRHDGMLLCHSSSRQQLFLGSSFRTSLSPTWRMTTQVVTTCIPGLRHRSAKLLHDLRPSTNRWSCYLLCQQESRELDCPCSAMSTDEGDAASGSAMFWKSVSVFGSETVPP